MADINKDRQKEVKVEDLLRLKRSEKPDDAFWNTFDRELHQRMLQTLVKKDPWYLQVFRMVSGRIAQTVAVGAAAAFLAMMVLRPAFIEIAKPGSAPAFAIQNTGIVAIAADAFAESAAAPVEVAMSDFDSALTRDYQMESITPDVRADYTQEFAHDTFEVAGYDSDAYVTDSASFAGTGLATSLVY